MIPKFANFLFLASIFFLPWQTAMILSTMEVSGEPSALGVFLIYVVEVTIAFAFLLRGRQQTNPQVHRIIRSVYFFLAATFFSLSVSGVEWVGWFHVIHVVSAVMLFSLLIDERTSIRQVLTIFLAGLTVSILVGWFQVLSGSSPDSSLLGIAAKDVATLGVAVVESGDERLMRAYGTFPHPNIFGGYVAFGIVALAWLARFVHSKIRLLGALMASSLLGATLIITFSRSAWLGLFIAFLVLLGLMLWQRRIPPRRALPVMALGLVSILSTLFMFHAQVFSRFDTSQRLEIISLEERASQYQTFSDVFFESPFLGVGPGAYTFILERLDPGHSVWSYRPIHNVYLLMLAELGLVGMVAFGWSLFSINPFAHTSMRTSGAIFAGTVGILLFVIGVFDHYLWTLWPGLALSALALGAMVKWGSEDAIDPELISPKNSSVRS
ncbi:MAG: O-antigen ligase-related protein [Candidatus Uhrbacteria bacterium GW2011_GWA2_52_8d]|uniref:O-antigen ligase-related protein n=1 Tax=Candidatus Uhrbacteria bacterium GW2011_GWA2_52_8d TaxID=1618979 RepID=A0A0G1XM52_9BACT|nr:MAG: O-antigen ligase-related protein [Candidatus Uhrbacteria bacterium GW2011_GWA2_52_8d]